MIPATINQWINISIQLWNGPESHTNNFLQDGGIKPKNLMCINPQKQKTYTNIHIFLKKSTEAKSKLVQTLEYQGKELKAILWNYSLGKCEHYWNGWQVGMPSQATASVKRNQMAISDLKHPLSVPNEFIVNLTRAWVVGKGELQWDNASIQIACGQVYGSFSGLMIDVVP